jgi:5-formyltetrahydrofolate cyclo-ligase
MLSHSKAELRAEMKRRLRVFSPLQLEEEGKAAAGLLGAAPFWSQYETILIFLSASLELDSAPLMESALTGGKKIFVPRIEGASLRFYRVQSASGPWGSDIFGIREPLATNPEYALQPGDFPALVVVPGLAFDLAGNRLGRGKAYYDRFFAENTFPCLKTGFCMDCQVLPRVPSDPWDTPMDALCTGRRLIQVADTR